MKSSSLVGLHSSWNYPHNKTYWQQIALKKTGLKTGEFSSSDSIRNAMTVE